MKIEKLFSRDAHLPFSVLFTSLASLLVAFNLPSFLQDPGLLLLLTAIIGAVMLCTSLALDRDRWLIAPIIGIAVTFVSAFYSTTVQTLVPCGTLQISQGYPYPWIRRPVLPFGYGCGGYLESMAGALPFGFTLRPIIAYAAFMTDVVFYTLLTLAILELVAATRKFQFISKQDREASRRRVLSTCVVDHEMCHRGHPTLHLKGWPSSPDSATDRWSGSEERYHGSGSRVIPIERW